MRTSPFRTKYEEGLKLPKTKPMDRGAITEPMLLATTKVEEAETRFSVGTQSFARAANKPYKGNTKAPKAKLRRICKSPVVVVMVCKKQIKTETRMDKRIIRLRGKMSERRPIGIWRTIAPAKPAPTKIVDLLGDIPALSA